MREVEGNVISINVLRAALEREGWGKFYTTKTLEMWASPSTKMHLSIMGRKHKTLCISMPGRAESIELDALEFAELRAILSEQWRKTKSKRLRSTG
jgi:hypothetical protein